MLHKPLQSWFNQLALLHVAMVDLMVCVVGLQEKLLEVEKELAAALELKTSSGVMVQQLQQQLQDSLLTNNRYNSSHSVWLLAVCCTRCM